MSQGINKNLKSLSPDEYLFRQDDLGNTLFILIQGKLDLWEENHGKSRWISTVQTGEVLGEKAFLTNEPHRRAFSAKAKQASQVLEFERKDIHKIEAIIPNFVIKLFNLAAQRLDRMNQLVSILRIQNVYERLGHCLSFQISEKGEALQDKSIQLQLSISEFQEFSGVEDSVIRNFFDYLKMKNVIKDQKNALLIIHRPERVLEVTEELKQNLKAA